MGAISRDEFVRHFPAFRNVPSGLMEEVLSRSLFHPFPAGRLIYAEGDACSSIAFLLSGKVRIFMMGDGGREITLNEIRAGGTCILNAACILSGATYPVNAVSLKRGEEVLVSASDFRMLMAVSEDVRSFIFGILSDRFKAILSLVEEVVFGRMDVRLREYLSQKSEDGVLRATHQRIASDLGTSREVVSRLLKDFEHKGIVTLTRGEITLTRR